ncbi:hypothetical protein B566_EDAN016587 [Ephemera danica]|nr:hypothetical protein B566_EDAN016587 [Ephemera danica]
MDVLRLGRTLTHEHLSAALYDVFYTPPPPHIPTALLKPEEFTLQNVGLEMEIFKSAGGGTIVENSSHGLSRNLNLMVEVPEVKCGVIAEVGSGWPIHVSFHPGRDPEAPFEIARVYLEAGGNADKAVMSHLDRTISDREKLLDFANTSRFYCQMQFGGHGFSHILLNVIPQMRNKGISQEEIDRITIDNPRDWLGISTDYQPRPVTLQ